MIEVCWAPMLAAFSVPLDQSDDEVVISLCLEGFRCAIHVTSVMSMKTHRDAFVTSLAKFTSLHSPADIKQKNVDAIKVGEIQLLFQLAYEQCNKLELLSISNSHCVTILPTHREFNAPFKMDNCFNVFIAFLWHLLLFQVHICLFSLMNGFIIFFIVHVLSYIKPHALQVLSSLHAYQKATNSLGLSSPNVILTKLLEFLWNFCGILLH